MKVYSSRDTYILDRINGKDMWVFRLYESRWGLLEGWVKVISGGSMGVYNVIWLDNDFTFADYDTTMKMINSTRPTMSFYRYNDKTDILVLYSEEEFTQIMKHIYHKD